ncbi:Transcription factor spt20, partial [Teratosphaeriaceae sp. CCFEE 6253]
MATAAVARPTNALRQRRSEAPRLSLGKRTHTAIGGAEGSSSMENGPQPAKRRKLEEPYVRSSQYILDKHRRKAPSLVIHLHDDFWRFGGQTGSFAYDSSVAVVLRHLQRGTVPHELLGDLLRDGVVWYDGCLIAEVVNHRTAKGGPKGGKKGRGRDEGGKGSMHAYTEHVTPSPFVPYPVKNEEAETKKADDDARTEGERDKGKDGPKTYTVVLHPTELSRHHEVLLLANTPASEMRINNPIKKKGTDTPTSAHPPPTPSLSVPPTPLMTARSPSTKDPKMCLDAADATTFAAALLLATEAPLYLSPVSNPQDAARVLALLSPTHPTAATAPPEPKQRKRTTAQLAAEDAQAAEAERRMLIMDERRTRTLGTSSA